MSNKKQLNDKVLNFVLTFEDSFTVEQLFGVLREANIMDDENKEQVIDIVDNLMESSIIQHVPLSDKYFVF